MPLQKSWKNQKPQSTAIQRHLYSLCEGVSIVGALKSHGRMQQLEKSLEDGTLWQGLFILALLISRLIKREAVEGNTVLSS